MTAVRPNLAGLTLVLLLGLGACVSTPDAAAPPAAPTSGPATSTTTGPDYLDVSFAHDDLASSGQDWYELTPAELTELFAAATPLESDQRWVTVPGAMIGRDKDLVVAPRSTFDAWREATLGDRVAIAGSAEPDLGWWWWAITATEFTDQGRTEVLGPERDRYNQALSVVPHATLEDLISLATDPAANAAWAAALDQVPSGPSSDWEDLPPDRRSLDPDDTPRELLDELSLVEVTVELPEDWALTDDIAVCTRVPNLGNNECALLASSGDHTVTMSGYVNDARNLELFFIDHQAGDQIGDARPVDVPATNELRIVILSTEPTRAALDNSSWQLSVPGG